MGGGGHSKSNVNVGCYSRQSEECLDIPCSHIQPVLIINRKIHIEKDNSTHSNEMLSLFMKTWWWRSQFRALALRIADNFSCKFKTHLTSVCGVSSTPRSLPGHDFCFMSETCVSSICPAVDMLYGIFNRKKRHPSSL